MPAELILPKYKWRPQRCIVDVRQEFEQFLLDSQLVSREIQILAKPVSLRQNNIICRATK
jgi:hypothetical protein